MPISLLTRSKARKLLSVSFRKDLRRLFLRAVQAAAVPDRVCLSLSDDDELHQLNKQYADEDHATDVLSFTQSFEIPLPSHERTLGDVIVSIETAQRQADLANHSLLEEVFHLSVHGLCHLMGYDHATKGEELVMFALEKRLRDAALAKGKIKPALVAEKAK